VLLLDRTADAAKVLAEREIGTLAARGGAILMRRFRRTSASATIGVVSESRRKAGRTIGQDRSGLLVGADRVTRCWWAGADPLYVAYHDREWGRPLRGDDALFEMLCLEAFQAGLAWITILRKREAFREAFEGLRVESVARFGAGDIARLMADARIVRNRAKIEATIGNARAALELPDGGGRLTRFVWSFAPPARPARVSSFEKLPSVTPEAVALSTALKARGFRFVGPTIVYSFMQAVGMVDDHLAGCEIEVAPRG
jgi:DNA-3-methyladenine glycosylase I